MRTAAGARLVAVAAGVFFLNGASAAVAAPPGEPALAAVLAQGADTDGSKKTDVSELWELYPIDPADAGTPLPTPEPDGTGATGAGISPGAKEPAQQAEGAPAEGGEEVPTEGDGAPAEAGGDATGDDRGRPTALWMPWLALGAVVLLVAGGGAALAARRSTRGGEQAVPPPQRRPARRPPRPVAGAPAQAGGATRGASTREHVRIHLHDGRRIEGWRKSGGVSRDHRVIVLDVHSVYDSAGRKLAASPLDSFVLPPQVDHIETLD